MVRKKEVAVLVIDMVREFADLENGKVANPNSAALVPIVYSFIKQAREQDALIIWVVDSHRSDKPDWELLHVRDHCIVGTEGVELVPPLNPNDKDYIITKRRYSAFVGTDLDLILRDNNIDTLILIGTKTNVCIRATAQDAFSLNYSVVGPRDCVATDKQHLHEANLEDINRYMGKVVSSEVALGLLGE